MILLFFGFVNKKIKIAVILNTNFSEVVINENNRRNF